MQQRRSAKKERSAQEQRSAQRRSEGALRAERRSVQRRSAQPRGSSLRAAEDGATTKVEWRSEFRRNEGASSSMGGGEVISGVLRAAARWRSGSRQ